MAKTWEERIAHAKKVNAQNSSAGVKSTSAVKPVTATVQEKSWDDRINHTKRVNAAKQAADYQKYIQSDEYKYAKENEKRIKSGLGYNVNNGQIYTFDGVTKDSLQKSISWADSEIEKLKAQGGHSTKVGEWTDKLLTYAGYGDKTKDRFSEADNITESSARLRELESQRAVYTKYLDSMLKSEDLEKIKSDALAENKFGAIFNIDNEQKLYFLNAGEEGYSSDSYFERKDKKEQLKAELQSMGYDDIERYIENYSEYRSGKTIEPILEFIEKGIVKSPVAGGALATVANIATSPMRGVGQAFDSITGALGIHGYAAASLPAQVSETTNAAVSKVIKDNINNEYIADLVSGAYSGIVSGLESAAIGTGFDKMGEFVLSLSSATSAYKEAKDRGLSESKALATGVTAGIFEALFEHMSLEKLRAFKASPATNLKSYIGNILKQSFTEGMEEVSTDIANETYDYLINGGLSQYEQALRSGITPKEYAKEFVHQLHMTGFGGAIAGGGMVGVAGTASAIKGSIDESDRIKGIGRDTKSLEITDQVLQDAKKQGGITGKRAASMEKKIAAGENVSDKALGKIRLKTTKQMRTEALDNILSGEEYSTLSQKEKNAIRSSVLTFFNNPMKLDELQRDVLQTENGKSVLKGVYEWQYEEINTKIKTAKETKSSNIRAAVAEGNTETLVKKSFEAETTDGHKVSAGAVRGIVDGELEIVQDKATGATAKLSQLKIQDEDAGKLYNALQRAATSNSPMTADAMNVAIAMYNRNENNDPEAYISWAHDAYKAGMLKKDNTVLSFAEFERMFEGSYSGDITREQLYSMYEAGAKNLELKPGVTLIGTSAMTKFQREQVFILDKRAKEFGLHIVITKEKLTTKDGRKTNAIYVEGTNRIVLSLDSDFSLLLVHAGHEIFHYAKNQNADMAHFLQDEVINLLKSDSKYDFDEIYKQVSEKYDGLSEDAVLEEIAAQYLGVVFASEDNIRKTVASASTEQKSFLKKIVNYLKKFISDLKKLINTYGDRDKTVRAAVETPVEQLSDMCEKFEKLLKETAEKENTATETGGVKASLSVIGLDVYNKDSINKIKMRNGVIINSIDELKNYVAEALSGDIKKNLHLGAIPKTIIARIERDINAKIFTDKQYTFVVSYDDIRHVSEHFSDVDMLTSEIVRLYDILSNYDSVECLVEEKGRKKLRLEKSYEHAEYRSIEIVSNKKSSVDLISFYVTKKHKEKGSQSVPPATQGSLSGGARLPDNSVTQETPAVNKNDMREKSKYSLSLDETGGEIDQMKLENESFFQYLERLGDKIGNQIKAKRAPDSELIYDRAAFYEIAKKYNLFDADAENSFNKNKYSDTELVNSMEHIMVGISDGIISPAAGLERLARIQQDILRSGYELRYGKDKNGNAISEDAANAFKKDIRNKPIYVSKYTYSLLMEQYKTRRNLRNASFNQLSIREEDSENAPNIELLYGELLKKHPALLDDVTEQLDMVNELIGTERAVHPQVEYVSEKEGFKGFLDLSEAGVRRAADMLTEAFNVELVQGNLQQQYKELRGVRQSLDRTKRYYRNLLEDSAKTRTEREEKTAYIKRIVRTTKRLDKLLRKETDVNHIPEGLKEPVSKFLQIIQGSLRNSFNESLIDGSLSIAELNKAYAAYSTENTANTDEEYAEKLSQLQFVLHGDKRLRELSLEDLKTVEDVVTHFNFIVNEGNKMFVDELKRGYEHTASISVENLYPHIENRKKGLERIKDAEFKMLTPYMFFKHIGTHFEGSQEVTEILGELGNALFKGEEKTARNVEKVKNITQEIMQTWGYDSRWASDERDIVLESGQKVSMSSEKIMHTLAMYEREASKGFKTDHILAGGIVVNDSAPKTVTGIIKPIPEAIKTRRAFNKAQKERKARLKNNGGKIFVGMNDADRAKILKETALEVVDATDVVIREDVDKQVEELKTKYDGSTFKVIRELGEKFGVFKDYTNENVQLEMNYSIGSAKKSINVAENNDEDISDFVRMLSVFDDVIKNAQPVEVHEDKYKGTKKENTNLKQDYVLLSAFHDGSSIIPVEFHIKEFRAGVKNQLYVSVNLKRIEVEVSKAVGHKSPDAFRPTSTYKLSDIISNVNPLDSEFLKYIPASILDRQQVEGRNEGIRKEKLRIAEIERTGDVSVIAEVTEDEQRALAEKIAETMRVYISKNDIQMLREQLNSQQTGYYRALVKAMSEDGATLGNETSLKLFGTKKYTEKDYCPASVVSDYLLERFGVKDVGERRLKNRSFTKRITENANAPILIDNISEIYAKHMYEMCTYNGMTIPLESIERLLNYKLPDEYERVGDKIQIKKGKSYRELFREAFGDRGLQYLENLMRDLNGGIRVDNRGALNSMLTNFKRSAVSASLTVSLQQPGSVARAMFRINPQYFMPTVYVPAAAKILGKYSDKAEAFDRYDELLKYCPLAVIKDVGKFDTNVGQSFEDWILDKKPRFRKDIKEVNRIIPWLYSELEDAFMWLPGYLDRATWVHVWNAVKRETAHKNGVRVSKLTENMLNEAGERMSQVIRETQVYDSVLSRSELMRSKNSLTQMATSFMAEPTLTYNMMRYAATTAKHQPKVLVRAVASVLSSVILTNFLKNIARALRYDDEETSFGEILLSGTVVDFINDLNPLTYIPYLKDIWNLFEGYDIERADMTVFSKVVDAIKAIAESEDGAGLEQWEQLIISISMFTGIPVNNLSKDITGLVSKFRKGSPNFSKNALADSIKNELAENPIVKLIPPLYNYFDMSDERIIYNAILNNDSSVINRYLRVTEDDIEGYIDKGYSEADATLKATENAENSFHTKVKKGLVSEDIRIEEAAQALLASDTEAYEALIEELVSCGFDRNDVKGAVDMFVSSMQEKTYSSSETKDKALYSYDDLYRAIDSKNMTAAKKIFNSLTEGISKETVQGNLKSEYADDIYNAIVRGNSSEVKRLTDIFDEFEYDYHYAVILGLRENDERILEAAEARYAGNTEEYERLKADIVEDGFDENDVFNAIETETEKLAPKNTASTSSPESSYLYEAADLKRYAVSYNLEATKKAIKNFKDNGKDNGDIRTSLTSAFKKTYIEAWQSKDSDTCIKIREFLYACDVGYSSKQFNAWEKEANAK